MKLVTNEIAKQMNELYQIYGTYAEVARQTGFSPGTVKKYIKADYVPEDKREIKRWEGELPEFDYKMFRGKDFGALCELNDKEVEEVKELWKELDM